jgi:hypothetical protein
MPATRDLDIYQGDRYEHILTFVDSEGNPLNMSGPWRAQIRPTPNNSQLLTEFDIDTTDADTGILVITLTSDQTENLPSTCAWDLEQTDLERTYLKGVIRVYGEVTRD